MTASPNTPALRTGPDLIAFGALVALLLALHWPTFASLVSGWLSSETYAHGFLILPIALVFVWLRRNRVSSEPRTVFWGGLAAVVALSTLWTVASLINVQVLSQFASVALVGALVITLFGRRVAILLTLPLAYLLFMIPVGEELVPILMLTTADFVVGGLNLFGVPVYREGLQFSTSNGDFLVATACSGIRYLIASVALGLAFAFLTYSSVRKRVLFMCAAVLVPVVANWIRALGIVLIAEYSDLRMAVGIDHFIYGWFFFGIVMFGMFWVGSRYADPLEPETTQTGSPVDGRRGGTSQIVVAASLAAVLIAAGVAIAASAQSRQTNVDVSLPVLDGVPASSPADDVPTWVLDYPGAADLTSARYELADADIELRVAAFASQEQGLEWINSENRIAAAPWDIDTIHTVSLAPSPVPAVRQTTIHNAGFSYSVVYWYQSRGTTTASRYRAKWLELLNLFDDQPEYVVAVAVRNVDGTMDSQLLEFVAEHGGALTACLDAPEQASCRPR